MIQTLFLGRVDYERLERKGQLPDLVGKVVAAVRAVLDREKRGSEALAAAGFESHDGVRIEPLRQREQSGYWIDGDDPRAADAMAVLKQIHDSVASIAGGASAEELRVADYAAIRQTGYPGYLGGPFAFAAGRWS